jgi:metal-responsive CopG/Arc/MetJ family transcriptional regulator
MARTNKPKPSAGSVPTYIRFTSDQLIAMDEAVKKGSFLNRSEAARAAVRQMFGIPLTDMAPDEKQKGTV